MPWRVTCYWRSQPIPGNNRLLGGRLSGKRGGVFGLIHLLAPGTGPTMFANFGIGVGRTFRELFFPISGELFPRVGFIVTNLEMPGRAVRQNREPLRCLGADRNTPGGFPDERLFTYCGQE
jgi:hypothetical protein